ncbi:MAG: 6-carboxytetrahydropterin synthase QueD [Desulfatiglandaceae bacterium]
MYELKIVTQFAAAHQLRGYEGGCENLHGHNWKIEVFLAGEELGKDGMLMDFRRVKEAAKGVLDELDHKFLNELDAFKTLNPSSENIARHIFEALSRKLDNKRHEVTKVIAWESDSACAGYMKSAS